MAQHQAHKLHAKFRMAAMSHGPWRHGYKEPVSPFFSFFFFLPVVAIWLTAAHVLAFKYSHTPHIQPAKQMPDVIFLLFLLCLPMYDNTNKTHKPIPELRFWDQLYYLAKTFSLNEIFNLYQPHLIIGICYIKLNCFVFSFSFRIYCH